MRSSLLALLLAGGCKGQAAPTQTAPLIFPVVSAGAVSVSSARFLGVDPSVELTNSQLRNCRFGRSEKLPLVPALIEQTTAALRVQGQDVLALSGGRLPAGDAALAPARESLALLATHNRELSGRACYPWRAGPDDPASTPTLLIAMDAAAPAQDLVRLSQLALAAGLERQALWVQADSPAAPAPRDAVPSETVQPVSVHWAAGAWSVHVGEGQVLPLSSAAAALGITRPAISIAAPADVSVGTLASALATLRAATLPCVSVEIESGAVGADAPLGDGVAAERRLQQQIAVLPLFVGGAELVSGERCLAEGVGEPALLEVNPL